MTVAVDQELLAPSALEQRLHERLQQPRPGRPVVVAEGEVSIEQILQLDGMLALPHYIHRTVAPADIDDYQTVYAARPGAIAAPTAGLHFTDDVFKALADAGIRTATVTLHIGPGTFAPVRAVIIQASLF